MFSSFLAHPIFFIFLQSKLVIDCVALDGPLFLTAARPDPHFSISYVCDTHVPSVFYLFFCFRTFPTPSHSAIVILHLPFFHHYCPALCSSPPTMPTPTYACCIPTPFPVDGAAPTVGVVPVFGVSPSDHRHFHYFGDRRVLVTVDITRPLNGSLKPHSVYLPHVCVRSPPYL